ncbi:hypothetical protein IYW40_07190 [Methylocystis sp. H4A]|uniref:hypothetical protein n=1 Tax=Methylocystis sp. H4A TaxID=2785788 RepID=UPI0018C323DF|nr:hypothetical protein [Methylocystis sp. H4A]MBG0801266.1 hypothetical protein [Methylocystis sp. H4A]
MALNLDERRGPNGNRILRLLRSPDAAPKRAATELAAPPTAPDVLDVLRSARKRKATREQVEQLANKWTRHD